MAAPDLAVVTGAASGVGAATTTRFLKSSIPVVGVDLAPQPAEVDEVAWVQGDVSSEEVWERVLAISLARFGTTPSILVSNAALVVVGDLLTLSDDDWRSVFDVNLYGAVRGIRACLPGMIERRRGAIVTVASVDAYLAEQGLAAYCSSKGALLQLTRCVAMDHAPDGVRANCVCPGVIDTPFFRRHLETASDPERFLRVREARNPLGRLLRPDEVAAAVVFLAGEGSSGMTGATVTVDAGLSASFDFRTGEEGA